MTDDAIARLRGTTEKLPARLRQQILAVGADVTPQLVELLDARGWAPVHAVDLLCDLKATEALEAMLRVLARTDWADVLHDRLTRRLVEFGADALEPILVVLETTTDRDGRHGLCALAAQLGMRDPRLLETLRREFAEDEAFGALLLHDYGDPAAVPDVLGAIERFEPDFDDLTCACDFTGLVETFEHLGGVLSEHLRERNERWEAQWQVRRKQLAGALIHGAAAQRRPQNVGRNNLCPCGSGKKFKKCCIDARAGTW